MTAPRIVPARIAYAEIGDIALRYALRQSGRPRIVLVHEMGGSMENWDEAADLLSGCFDILTYDTRGAGLSEKIRGDVTIDDMVDDLAGLLDHVGWTDPVGIAGTAIGAATAIRLAVRSPERVAALAALSPALGVDPDKRAKPFESARRIEEMGVRAATNPSWDRVWPPHLRDDQGRAEAVRCRKNGNDPESFAALFRMVAGMQVEDDLPRLACPCLFLAGQHDTTRPPELVERYAAKVPGADMVVVESAHVMQAISPGLVAAHLETFFCRAG